MRLWGRQGSAAFQLTVIITSITITTASLTTTTEGMMTMCPALSRCSTLPSPHPTRKREDSTYGFGVSPDRKSTPTSLHKKRMYWLMGWGKDGVGLVWGTSGLRTQLASWLRSPSPCSLKGKGHRGLCLLQRIFGITLLRKKVYLQVIFIPSWVQVLSYGNRTWMLWRVRASLSSCLVKTNLLAGAEALRSNC